MNYRCHLVSLLLFLLLMGCTAPYEVVSRGEVPSVSLGHDVLPPFPLEADRNYRVGLELAKKKKYKEAIFYLEKAAAQMSRRMDVLYNLAATYTYIEPTSAQAVRVYRQALALGDAPVDRRKQILPRIYYNLATIYALRGSTGQALELLQLAFDHGFSDYHMISNDADMSTLRDNRHFQRLLKKKWPN